MDIGIWLRTLGLERYEQAFRDHAVDAEVLPELTDADLEKLGVLLGHRKKLLKAIAGLDPVSQPTARSPPAPDPGHQSAQAERRQLTVLFCDLVGSTALSAGLDPEDMSEVIRAYQDACAGVIMRFDGHLAKFMGDGVLAYFGWPRAHEDEAERAVRAGLALTEAIGRLRTPSAEPLAARVGIATGVVVVGDLVGAVASQEQVVVGDTPNLAARLQTLAAPGQVIVADATARLAGPSFALEDLGLLAVKGLVAPVRAHAVIGERSAVSRFEARTGPTLAPMVGRDQELGLLLERWALAKAGEGQGVLLVGEAGIGKSRIVRALLDAVAHEPHTRIRYQCSPYHTDSALWPVVQQLNRVAGFAPDEAPGARLDKLEALLARGATGGEIAPLVANLLGIDGAARYGALDLTPQAQRARTLEALIQQLFGLARQLPVLMVVEDSHWIDPTTLELIAHCLDRIIDAPVLIFLTSRPDDQPELAAHPHVTRLTLNRLSRSGVEAILARLGGGDLPSAAIDMIVARTDGVPLFVEELTKAVLEVGDSAVPASLHDSLMARLDRIPEVKEIAQIAACIGREFSRELLAAVAERPETELGAALDQLTAAELVFRRGMPPNASYIFKHALVRDAAYQSLLRSRRQVLHARVATAFQAVRPETAEQEPELLAHHLTQAGQSDRAIGYWRSAAQRAIERSAYRESVGFFEQALAALAAGPQADEATRRAIDLRLEMRPALGALGAYESIRGRLDEARVQATSIGDRRRLAQIRADEIHVLYQLGKLAEAIEVGEAAMRAAAEVDDRGILIQTSFNLGQAYFFSGDHRRAVDTVLAYVDDLKGRFRHDRLGTTGTSACIWLGNVAGAYARLGEFDAAIEYGEAATGIAGETGRPFDRCLSDMWLGHVLVAKGEVTRATAVFDRVLRLAREHELGFVLAWATGNGVADAYGHVGRAHEAKEVLAGSVDVARSANLAIALTWNTLGLGTACLMTGALGEARAHAQQGLEMATALRLGWSEQAGLRLLGTICRWLGPSHRQESERFLKEAVSFARRLEARPELAHALCELGQLLASTGGSVAARACFAEAIDLYRSMDMAFWLPGAEDMLREARSGCP